jgi:alcohol dehydrogenase class IV
MQFEFATASRIIFGSGKLDSIGAFALQYGQEALIISGAPGHINDTLLGILKSKQVNCTLITVHQEPSIDDIAGVLQLARALKPHLVIGIGGGSAMDSAKAIAALLSNSGNLMDYLEVIGAGKPLDNPSLPLITIPTTAGTGSEVTKNAVVYSASHNVKVSLRSMHLLPHLALVDPKLSISLPPHITATSGLDALSQLIEAYVCNNPNPLTDALCLKGIQHVSHSFWRAYDHGDDLPAREDMSLAALLSGLALANARLGAVHGLAGPIGGLIPAQHGAICAALLANVMEANLLLLQSQTPDHPILQRYKTIGKLLNNDQAASAESGVDWVRNFCQYTHIPTLSSLGLDDSMFPVLIENAMASSSMKGNPIPLSVEQLRILLQRSL